MIMRANDFASHGTGGEDLMELGLVSEETRGSAIGHQWDGGFGVRWP